MKLPREIEDIFILLTSLFLFISQEQEKKYVQKV